MAACRIHFMLANPHDSRRTLRQRMIISVGVADRGGLGCCPTMHTSVGELPMMRALLPCWVLPSATPWRSTSMDLTTRPRVGMYLFMRMPIPAQIELRSKIASRKSQVSRKETSSRAIAYTFAESSPWILATRTRGTRVLKVLALARSLSRLLVTWVRAGRILRGVTLERTARSCSENPYPLDSSGHP